MQKAWVSFNIFLPTGLGQIDKILSIFTHGKCIRGVGDAELFYPICNADRPSVHLRRWSLVRGRGTTGSTGSIDTTFSGAGKTYGSWPLTSWRVHFHLCPICSCSYSFIHSFIHSFIQLSLFNSQQIMIVPKDLKLKSNNSIWEGGKGREWGKKGRGMSGFFHEQTCRP